MFAYKEMRKQNKATAFSTQKRHEKDEAGRPRELGNLPGSTRFLQRNLGNSYLQSALANKSIQPKISATGGVSVIQRKCACGGTCASCASKEGGKSKIQTKLTVGPANDVYEQEADRVADAVMRMPEPTVQRQVESEEEEEELLQAMPLADKITPVVQRQVDEEELIQAKFTAGQIPEVTSALAARINALRGGGQPLDLATRAFIEPRFGHDFSQVRIHTDAHAAKTASSVHARAYTVGRDIVFSNGQYSPETTTGKRLLAHELTHVMQQTPGGAGNSNQLQRQVNFDADFTNINLTDGARATITNGDYDYEDADFSADAEITATAPTVAELNEWDVGILQDITSQWDRYYWRRANADGRGKFVERKFQPVKTRFRDQSDGATTVWSDDSEHQLLSALPVTPVGSRFRVSTIINTSDAPEGSEPVNGSAAPGMDASDGTRNIDIQRIGSRFDTWISARNVTTGAFRHLRRLNWNYQRSLDFTGTGATLAVDTETRKLGHHGPYDAGKKAPLTAGSTANAAVGNNANWSFNRVNGWT